jgi:class 3 adenylate cyclase
MAAPVIVTRELVLTSSPADVWPLLTDTDRTNRLVFGKGNVYRPIEDPSKTSARFVVDTRVAGFALTYEEAPFEWTLHKSFRVLRTMRSGPLRSYTYGMTFEPTAKGGSRVTIRLELVPRHWLLRPIAQYQGDRIVRDMAQLAETVDAHLRDKSPSPFLRPASSVNVDRLAHAERRLKQGGSSGQERPLDPAVIRTMIDLIRSGPDADLVRIRPLELAREHGHDGREVVRAFLHAVTVGIVELRWALICPSCRTANDQVTSLAELKDGGHCQLCDLSYGIELDRAVEATFVPHPSVRSIPDQMFCVGGPWRTPHVVVQAVVDDGASRELEAPAEAGRYRLFARGGATASIEVVDGGPTSTETRLEAHGFTRGDLRVAPGGTLAVTNGSGEPLHVKIERLAYASLAATAHYLTTLGEFRRFFSKDLLKPSTPLKVASCAILFSDLTGSTALYTKAGDAAAFRLVDDHFDVLRHVIDEHKGAVVKTMGDAIMAAFIDPVECVRASIACLYAFEKFRVDADNGELTSIKLGLYAGPCYVVTANDAIDYFGQTVNCASRIQHCAGPGEILFEEDVWNRLDNEDKAQLRLVEHLETRVKGVEHPLKLVRTKLANEVVSERSHAKSANGSEGRSPPP